MTIVRPRVWVLVGVGVSKYDGDAMEGKNRCAIRLILSLSPSDLDWSVYLKRTGRALQVIWD